MQFKFTNFLTIEDEGLNICIDPTKNSINNSIALISHAHSDHFCNLSKITYATKETQELLTSILPNPKFDFRDLELNKQIDLTKNIKLTPLDSGHILGSCMFKFDIENKSILYTSDLNSNPSLTSKSAKPVYSDILFIESTFGKKIFDFKERGSLYFSLSNDIKKDLDDNKFVILGGYSLGKNQELISFVNQYLGVVPLVDSTTFKFSEIYNKYGKDLKYKLLDHNIYSSNILIMPLSLINKDFLNSLRLQLRKPVSSYIMTGWNFSRGSRLVHISDHSDYKSLIEFVDKVNPKIVYTMHGFSKEFAKNINYELGISAKPISEINQKSLLDFI